MTEQNEKKTAWHEYLIEALKEDLSSKEAELCTIRNSVRYKIGGWVLEAWPISWRTFSVIAHILVVYIRLKKRNSSDKNTSTISVQNFALQDQLIETLVFGHHIPESYLSDRTVCSEDCVELIRLLDSEISAKVLVIRLVDQAITRRIQRLQLNGWRVIWWPEKNINENGYESSQVKYLVSHADESRPRSDS